MLATVGSLVRIVLGFFRIQWFNLFILLWRGWHFCPLVRQESAFFFFSLKRSRYRESINCVGSPTTLSHQSPVTHRGHWSHITFPFRGRHCSVSSNNEVYLRMSSVFKKSYVKSTRVQVYGWHLFSVERNDAKFRDVKVHRYCTVFTSVSKYRCQSRNELWRHGKQNLTLHSSSGTQMQPISKHKKASKHQ